MRALRGLKASPPHECEGSHLKSKSEAPNLNAGFAREFCAYLLAVLLAGLAALLSPGSLVPIIAKKGVDGIRGEDRCRDCC